VPAGVRRCGPEAYHAVRIECGVPMMGAELDTSTIPAEAGIVDRSVSWTKGCYTGQELVARIDSRGSNVPRRLTGVVLGADVMPPVGATVHAVAAEAESGLEGGPPAVGEGGPGEVGATGAEVGRLTSVARSVDLAAPVALAYLRRAVTPPAPVTVVWADGRAPARAVPLPLR
jgi:folate-binding protein YgfZ